MPETLQLAPLPEVASRLHNGAWVLDIRRVPQRAGTRPTAIVLGFHGGSGAVQPFCVWVLVLDGDPAYAIHGDYYAAVTDAVVAFEAR